MFLLLQTAARARSPSPFLSELFGEARVRLQVRRADGGARAQQHAVKVGARDARRDDLRAVARVCQAGQRRMERGGVARRARLVQLRAGRAGTRK